MGCTLAGPPLGQSPAAFLEFHLGARPRLPSPRRGGRPAPRRALCLCRAVMHGELQRQWQVSLMCQAADCWQQICSQLAGVSMLPLSGLRLLK